VLALLLLADSTSEPTERPDGLREGEVALEVEDELQKPAPWADEVVLAPLESALRVVRLRAP